MSSKITIIGAGSVGATIAYCQQRCNLLRGINGGLPALFQSGGCIGFHRNRVFHDAWRIRIAMNAAADTFL